MNASRITVPMMLLVVAIYLVVTAPKSLADKSFSGESLTTETFLKMLANENNVARTLYTDQIVALSEDLGVQFREDWASGSAAAGPLPALFLRRCALFLTQSGHPIKLRLASDFPIEPDNKLGPDDVKRIENMRTSLKPDFYVMENPTLQVAMFPDVASSMACVKCHNEHKNSAKRDWALGDVMGVTTWSWPSTRISHKEAFALVMEFRKAVKKSYRLFLSKIHGHDGMPEVGKGWPRENATLPDEDEFMRRYVTEASNRTLDILMSNEPSK
jgi:adenylate cyclase